ncbi:probable E3 SUMO-protein ligase RNF212 [Phacochoerus africanus]|uniref:probable E3 SUMO-protein ligase RNF212 n=1 Tax=Phacochoerus africanus TaxID=41426 RepID=UPI001FD9F4E7|nr:probable E3 SUMO-protein ligase RNF212 [Phacochoerus africanus]
MASWVFCNRCFQPPHRALGFSLTSCGHVYCDVCLRSGKRDECLICQVPCRTVLLSKHTDSDIQAFFGGIDGLCRKYARETSQVLEFQDKHRRRLFAFYAEKISSLEESLRESALQVEQLSRVRWSQQAAFSTIKDLVSTQPACLPPDAAASERVESMEVDLSPSPRRKPEGAAGPARMSLLSPPRDGRMGEWGPAAAAPRAGVAPRPSGAQGGGWRPRLQRRHPGWKSAASPAALSTSACRPSTPGSPRRSVASHTLCPESSR